MNTKQIKSSFIARIAMTLLVTVFTTIGAWAQTPTTVSTEDQLTAALADGANIQLIKDIQLSNYLNINGVTVTIDLNGHTLSRSITDYDHAGHVIYVHGSSTLTLTSTAEDKGIIKGGMAYNGGAINIPHGNTVSATNIIFQNNTAREHAGAIWNNGTFTATDCTFTGNSCTDVGAIYNAVQTDNNVTYAGTATLTNCTITGNWGTTGAGALANALGNTVMTLDGCTITGNEAGSRGAGIWNGGTLNMKGAVTVTDNTDVGGVVSNVFLKSDKVITVTGSLAGSKIGVDMEDLTGTFTSGYSDYNSGVAPNTLFTVDRSSILALEQDNGEVRLISFNPNPLSFIERSWDDTNKKVVSTEKGLSTLIAYDATPHESEFKEVTNAPADEPNQWFGMGGYSTTVPEYYVVSGNVNRETIVVQGSDVHLILCDGATLTLTGGMKVEGDNKLYIHCQSYGGSMGRLIVTNKNSSAAGIGSASHEGKNRVAGELVIYGGHIEATGGSYAAGIGSCSRVEWKRGALCTSVTVYGGYVKAKGGSGGAGIGGGSYFYYDTPVYIGVDGGQLNLYDGTVIAQGGSHAAGVGGGEYGSGGTVTVYGGSLTATGKEDGAGIGGGSFKNDSHTSKLTGGKLTVYGGMVTATGGDYAAGIGGGNDGGGAEVHIEGGMVTATGGDSGAGIGGGYWSRGGIVTITGGTVIAKAGTQGGNDHRAIGPGRSSNNYGALTIGSAMMVGAGNNGSVESIFDAADRKNACWYRSYAEISPCTHPAGITYTINDDGTHSSHCKHCALSITEGHSTGTCICGYYDGSFTITIATSSGTGYEGVGEPIKVGKDKLYTLPVCTTFPEGYDFAGWVVNPESQDNGILPNEGETLLQAGENITVTDNVSIFARYQALEISLVDDGDNGETLYTYNERKAASVTLTGRTLWKDGDWNTLCLPFALDSFEGTPLEGATVMTFTDASFAGGTLTLNFTEVTSLEAGQPCIVKWASGENVTNPVFTDVTISDTTAPVVTDVVTFKGIFSPYSISGENKKLLFVGAANKVYYPTAALNINAFRAFFELQGDLVCGEVSQGANAINNFVLNFEEGKTTGITSTIFTNLTNDNSWYSLDGRRLNGRPTQKGVYINNGKKVVIK